MEEIYIQEKIYKKRKPKIMVLVFSGINTKLARHYLKKAKKDKKLKCNIKLHSDFIEKSQGISL